MTSGFPTLRLSEGCMIRPPKAEARAILSDDDLVSFLPMDDLGVFQKEIVAVKERKLKEVAGSYTYFANNDVLLAKITPCFENGKLGIARNLTNGVGFGSSEYIVFRPDERLLPEYLFYFLSLDEFREEGKRQMMGSVGHKRVSLEFIENTEIPVPPIEEQRRIVAILDEAFAAIDKAKANTEKNLQNARELFDSYLNNIFSNPALNEWNTCSLGDEELLKIIDGDRGKNYPAKTDFLDEGYCLFMNTKNVRHDGLEFNSVMFITEKKDKSLGKGKLTRGDVVLTTRGTIGNIGVYDTSIPYDNVRINSGMLIFRPNPNRLVSEYLFEILRSEIIRSQIVAQVSGAAQPQLPIKTLVNFTLPVPVSVDEQKKIVEKLRLLALETSELEGNYQSRLRKLADARKSILQKAFSGAL